MGDFFYFEGIKYKVGHLIENTNGYVACVDTITKKVTRFYIDTTVEIEDLAEECAMKKIQIGDTVKIKAEIVDYNDGAEKAKVRITGYTADKHSFVERYIWLNYNDIKPLN